jgi:arylsulfatase A-like enzyme
MTDRWLGVFLDKLHDLRLERETVIMLVSDHGFFLGDHGLTGKIATRLHPELIHVPLIVVHPERRRRGDRSRYFAQTHDVAPTLLSMAGVGVPRGMDGVDLSRLFRGGQPPERDYAWGGYGNSYFVKTDRWSMFGANAGGDLHLYNRRRDFREYRNLAGSHRGKTRQLFGVVRRRGRGLPTFPY